MEQSNRIRELRKRVGLTQTDMADRLGISQPQFARLENGKNEITMSQLRKVASILGVKPYELFLIGEQPEALTEEEKEFLRLFRKSKASANDEAAQKTG